MRRSFVANSPAMKKSVIITAVVAVVAYTLGAAYGRKTPGVNQVAAKLPGAA